MHDRTVRYGGVDWATDDHAVCVVDGDGVVVAEFVIEHTADGMAELCRRLRGVARVAIERPDGPVVDALRSRLRTALKAIRASLDAKDLSGAKAALSKTVLIVDKMATKGIIHRNTAGRYKSRLTSRLSKASA